MQQMQDTLRGRTDSSKEKGTEAEIIKVEDIPSIMKYGVMSTPALVIDGKVAFSGKTMSAAEIKALL